MTSEPGLILQLPRDGAVDRQFRTDPPQSVASGQVVLDQVQREADGRLAAPEAAEIVMSVPSPEALAREPGEVRDVIDRAPGHHGPLMIIVEAAGNCARKSLRRFWTRRPVPAAASSCGSWRTSEQQPASGGSQWISPS